MNTEYIVLKNDHSFPSAIPSSILNHPLHSFQSRKEPHSSLPPSTFNPCVSTSHPHIHPIVSGFCSNRSDSIPLLNCPSQSRFFFHQYTPKTTTALSPLITPHSSESQFSPFLFFPNSNHTPQSHPPLHSLDTSRNPFLPSAPSELLNSRYSR